MKILLLILLGFVSLVLSAQNGNLVKNGGFDKTSKKVKESGQIDLATGWTSPTTTKADLFSKECKEPTMSAPNNKYGSEAPEEGNNYAGIVVYTDKDKAPRSFINGELNAPLDPDRVYCVKFLVSLSDLAKYGVNNIGLYLGTKPVTESDINNKTVKPQIMHSQNKIMNEQYTWETICGKYKAKGGEKYISIGNFTAFADVKFEKMKKPKGFVQPQTTNAYYFIESVYVAPMDSAKSCVCEKSAIADDVKIVYQRDFSSDTKIFPEKAIEYKVVYFDAKQTAIPERANSTLDNVVQLMKDNPNVKIEIIGHTDVNEEKTGVTIDISGARAKSVYLYLLAKGLEEGRMHYKGAKAENPTSEDESSTGLAKNRRVEFKIVQ